MSQVRPGIIRVLAGPNGAGKSSVGGAHLRATGADYFNPDEVARELLASGAVASLTEANAHAWKRGAAELQRAIVAQSDFTFETTLGGNIIARLLAEAQDRGYEVHVRYVALESADLHVERVRERVAAGGHDIPEERIRSRYDSSREHLRRFRLSLPHTRVLPPLEPRTSAANAKQALEIRQEPGFQENPQQVFTPSRTRCRYRYCAARGASMLE